MNFNQELSRIQQNISTVEESRNFELFKLALNPAKSRVISKLLNSRSIQLLIAGVLLASLCAYAYVSLLGNIVSEASFASALFLYLGLVLSGGLSVGSFYLSFLLNQERKAIHEVSIQVTKMKLVEAYGLGSEMQERNSHQNIEEQGISIASRS